MFQDRRRHGPPQEHPRIGQPADAEKLCQKQMEGERHQTHLKDGVDGRVAWDVSPASLSLQQAFNATAVIRHMRRLQLGTSFGSSNIHSASATSDPQSRPPAKSQSVDCAPLSLSDCE